MTRSMSLALELASLPAELSGLLIAVFALIVALPAFANAIWGPPRLRTRWRRRQMTSGERLGCEVFNQPVLSRALKLLRVTRSPAWVDVCYSISELGTGKVVAYKVPIQQSMVLHPSLTPIFLPIIGISPSGNASVLGQSSRRLAPGYYRLTVSVNFDGKRLLTGCRIRVGREPLAILDSWIRQQGVNSQQIFEAESDG